MTVMNKTVIERSRAEDGMKWQGVDARRGEPHVGPCRPRRPEFGRTRGLEDLEQSLADQAEPNGYYLTALPDRPGYITGRPTCVSFVKPRPHGPEA
jgi:hypothetical protein